MAAVANERSPPPPLASDYGELERPVFPWPGVLQFRPKSCRPAFVTLASLPRCWTIEIPCTSARSAMKPAVPARFPEALMAATEYRCHHLGGIDLRQNVFRRWAACTARFTARFVTSSAITMKAFAGSTGDEALAGFAGDAVQNRQLW